MRFDCIFFDSGGTLYDLASGVEPSLQDLQSGKVRRVHGLLWGMGIDVAIERLAEIVARQEHDCSRRLGKAYNYFRLMQAVSSDLDLSAGPETAACLADAYAGPRLAAWLFPGTVDAVRTLHENGFRMGIIANTAWPGFCMDRAFAGVGLLSFFDVRVYSGDLGISKPDPAIFRHAEKLAGLKGKRVLYVGNDLDADVRGAAGVGWKSAFRRQNGSTAQGLADFEFDHAAQLVRYCLSGD